MRLLPGTLRQTTITLRKVQRFANILGPSSRALIPAIREIPGANRALSSLAQAETGDVRDKIRPFVRDSRPLVRNLRPAVQDLSKATPKLSTSFTVLNHLFNTLAFNPNGREDPNNANRQEGFLFWLAWLDHQALTLFSSQDANGGFRPLFLTLGCSSAKQLVHDNVSAEFALNLTPILDNPALCGNGQTGGLGAPPSLPSLPSLPLKKKSAGANAGATTKSAANTIAKTVTKTAATTGGATK